MGIHHKKSPTHWNYFLAIESDLEKIGRFIEPCEENYSTYSIELARVLLAASSEVDVVLKSMCERLNKEAKADSISKYMTVVMKAYPDFADFGLYIPRWSLGLTPWSNWSKRQVPLWWTANNKVKHHRDSKFSEASLKNALNSVGALFIANLYLNIEFARIGYLTPMPALFRVEPRHFGGTTLNDVEFGVNYVL